MWKAKKCNRLVGAINVLAVTAQPTTQFQAASYTADNGDLGNFGAIYPRGTVFALRQCLY